MVENGGGVKGSMIADLALVVICIIWGTTFAIVKNTVTFVDPVLLIALRMIIAAVIVTFLCWRRGLLRKMGGETWRSAAVVGIFVYMGFVLQTIGLTMTTASKTGFITGLAVVFTPMLSPYILKKNPEWYSWAGVAIAVLGLGFLSLEGWVLPSIGDVYVLACALCFGFQIVLLEKYSPRLNGMLLSMAQFIWIGLLALVTAAPKLPQVADFKASTWLTIIYLGVMATAVAFMVQTIAQRYVPAIRASIIMQTEPVAGVLFAWLLLGEALTARQWFGALLILVAVGVCQYGDYRKTRKGRFNVPFGKGPGTRKPAWGLLRRREKGNEEDTGDIG
ncbi:MAG TPA: DMT family transporter [Bacillota bacterium]|nr:DMT family transporter [Bacillota bacterium]